MLFFEKEFARNYALVDIRGTRTFLSFSFQEFYLFLGFVGSSNTSFGWDGEHSQFFFMFLVCFLWLLGYHCQAQNNLTQIPHLNLEVIKWPMRENILLKSKALWK